MSARRDGRLAKYFLYYTYARMNAEPKDETTVIT